MRCVELFTGCGGLAMGLSRAGFKPQRMSEWDKHSVLNVSHNKDRGVDLVQHWPIHQEDVRSVDWSQYDGLALTAGGPPCQPFSIGGRHKGHEDQRDMWPEAVRVVRETHPAGFIFENVRGLMRSAFADYLRWVVLSLSMPHVLRTDGEDRAGHLERLEALRDRETLYEVVIRQVNAADYGAAQKRHRVLILGTRRDLGLTLPELRPTHSRERLLWDQWITGEYWKRHGLKAPPTGPDKIDAATVRRLRDLTVAPQGLPWRTIRDAFQGLGEPGARPVVANHVFQPGARSYTGHTGSPIDMPAKALKARGHGVPGGENMLAHADGSVRYFTVREAARLQGLPDDYEFVGSWSENMRQCGNAVPVQLAEAVGRAMYEMIGQASVSRRRRAA